MSVHPKVAKTKIKKISKVHLAFLGLSAIAAVAATLTPPKTLSITNMNPLIAPGGSVTLNWIATNVASCTASALPASSAWFGEKALSGSQTISSVIIDTKYTLVCTATDGTTITKTSASAVVVRSAPVITMVANPNQVVSGQTSKLAWNVLYANTCAPSDAWAGSGSKSVPFGSYLTPALTTAKKYTLSCTGPLGTTSKSVTVNVGSSASPTPAPTTVSLSASVSSVIFGGNVTLTWTATAGASCLASAYPSTNGWTGAKAYSGSQTISLITDNTTYTLSCLGLDGILVKKSASVTVAVPPVPPLASSPSSVRNVLVILWDPHRLDNPAPSKTYVESVISSATGSLVDYYRNQSGGKVEIHVAGVLGWYGANKPADHYWNHPADANDGFIDGHVEKWAEAIIKADKDFDFSLYDSDKDGYVSEGELGILVVIPQKNVFGTVRYVSAQETPVKTPLKVDNVSVWKISEVYMGADTSFSVMAHEEGHLLFGFPDMYDSTRPLTRPYRYSLMDFGTSNVQLDPYNKYWPGWLTTKEITADGYYLVNDVQTYREVLKITKPGNPKEFFLIENRQHGTYDTDIIDTGIEVWSIYDDRTVGDWGRKNISIIRPTTSGDSAWYGPSGTNGYDLRLKWRDGSDSGITIKDFPASSANMKIFIDMP